MRRWIGAAAFAVVGVMMFACGSSSSSTGTGGGSTSSGSSTTSSGKTSSSGAGGASSSSGMSSTSSGMSTSSGAGGTASSSSGMAAGHCGLTCMAPADCCPMGIPNCPGAYPNNWTCSGGQCGAPSCSTNDECTFNGAIPKNECHKVSGLGLCFIPCMMDSDCPVMGETCTGKADDGAKFCETAAKAGCKGDKDCAGYGKCNMGACECSGDMDCTAKNTKCFH